LGKIIINPEQFNLSFIETIDQFTTGFNNAGDQLSLVSETLVINLEL
jgi:hypothetical protein